MPGALFSCGNGHAVQGDGEICMLCSLAVDLRITQVVNGREGVHAMIAREWPA